MLKNKVVLLTAAAAGIGKVTALKLAALGAKLLICDIDEQNLNEVKKEAEKLGAEVLAMKYDAGSVKDMDAVFNATMKRFGRIDVLINNAGIAGPSKSLMDITVEEWDQTMEVNLRGTFYFMKLVAPVMIKQGGGKIVNLASQTGKKPLLFRSPYCASKIGVIGLTREAANELGKYNITVNSVCPGAVAGDRVDRVHANSAKAKGISFEEYREQILTNIPLHHMIQPEDVAETILFLSDEERSNSTTGEDVNVNGGMVMY